jgi:long-subunit acyl-CoA synthetase (AMP-forming)
MVIPYIVLSDSERWSRQTSKSEWIPLANPRQNQKSQSQASIPSLSIADSSIQSAGQVSVLSLPPTLQQQYQDQLLQLQKTQESIQRLLLLQQQLKAQQQILQVTFKLKLFRTL